MDKYIPPFSISNKMLEYVSNIIEKITKLDNYKSLERMPILRRNNKIHSIHASLAIEANSLSFNQVKDVINGKLVLGPQKEIQEVKNAYNAYELIKEFNPYSQIDLKRAHGIMTYLTVEESGEYRKGQEGVFDGDVCIFVAPPPDKVYGLMNDLFNWMQNNKKEVHPLILSSIFHYEFVFIHPFKDGNGRMARLWQNVLLSKWKSTFEYIPIESQIKTYQEDYYKAISACHINGNCNVFIEFMLKMIDEVLNDILESSAREVIHINDYVTKLLNVMEEGVLMSANEIMEKLGIKSKETLRANYLNPAIANGLVKLAISDKPTSKNQKYYKI